MPRKILSKERRTHVFATNGNSHKFGYHFSMLFKTMSAIGCAVACLSATAIAEDPYKFLNEIPIGGEGGWDILTIDSAAHRLYLSHATKVVVVDLEKNAVVGEIADTPGVHGFLAVPEVQRGFSSNGKENKASVVDLKTLRTVSKIDTGESPDALVYDPKHGEVYIFNHQRKFRDRDRRKDRQGCRAQFRSAASPEFAAVDATAGRVYCNIEDKSEVVGDRYGQTRSGRALAARSRRRTERHRARRGASPIVLRLSQQDDDDARHRNRQSRCDRADRRRRGWLRLRRCDAACFRVLRRRHDDDRERRNAGETDCRANVENRTRRAHDGARSANASNLFAVSANFSRRLRHRPARHPLGRRLCRTR